MAWWAGNPLDMFGCHLGTNGEVVGAVVWAAWLLLLCFVQTGDDYMHITKRFGIIASSQLPFQYLLALKSPYSPLQILTRSSHETLNGLHQHLGYMTTFLLYLHAALYINLYVIMELLAAKLQEAYVLCGVVGIVAFTAVGTTALTPVRRWSYRVFYVTHVTLATALLPVLFFHVSHIRIYLYETAPIYAFNALLRGLNTQKFSGTVKLMPDSSLVKISISLPKPANAKQVSKWQAGQHAYVSLAGHPFLRAFRSNPFTVASIPAVDGTLTFVARVLDGNTAKLAQQATGRKLSSQTLSIEGPYGVATHADKLLGYDRVLLVAGGVGATFLVPLYRQLLADLSPSKGSYRRQRVNFLWMARSKADVAWALPADAKERASFTERLTIRLTGSISDASATDIGFANGSDREEGTAVYGEGEDGIELEEQKQLLSTPESEDAGTGALTVKLGRPNITQIIDQTFAHSPIEKVAVVVCGPRSLGQALRRNIGRYVTRGREVWFWDESFAF
ncbi:hypothetical protein LTR36_009503 [Oleoguttula mirabilis]|uniref:ferric-chelate reductase (NADPH) n=1 Tax=Oleoguttula mirabilis TaxID=1507867 RepID=A0AAV9JSX9_9PEZI|nr:hypothetical protein LTR36_009503 [Oleoguttula mirabilis]